MSIFRDLNHTTRDKNTLNDLDALYQAAITLLTAKRRCKAFSPEYGGDIENYLFELCDEQTAFKLKNEIDALFSQDSRFQFNYSGSTIIPEPENKRFNCNLKILFPALGSSEYSLNIMLKQKERQ